MVIKDSKFYEVKKTAAIWHAGNYNLEQKFVLKNCSFDGIEGFELGRHHYEAQFYLLNCTFSEKIADINIYKVFTQDPERNNPYFLGDRKYFYDCTKEGIQYPWYKDNLDKSSNNPSPDEIDPLWTFGGRWDPELRAALQVIGYQIDGYLLILKFNEIVTVRDIPVFENQNGKKFRIKLQRFTDNDRLMFVSDDRLTEDDLISTMKILQGRIIASTAYVHERSLSQSFSIIKEE